MISLFPLGNFYSAVYLGTPELFSILNDSHVPLDNFW